MKVALALRRARSPYSIAYDGLWRVRSNRCDLYLTPDMGHARALYCGLVARWLERKSP